MSTYYSDRDKARIAYLLGGLAEAAANLGRLAEAEIESAALTGQIGEALTGQVAELRKLLYGDDTER